jgi:hypothetical protein
MTFVLGQVFRNAGRRVGTDGRPEAHFTLHVQRPYAVYLRDTLVHRDLWPALDARVRVYSAAEGFVLDQASRREEDLLPIGAEVKRLGTGLAAAATREVTRYQEMISWAMGRMGWNPEHFAVHRMRLAYPPMPSSVVISIRLPRE